MIIGDYIRQHLGEYHNPLEESLLTNQYNGMTEVFLNTDQMP
jgi:hypothetical protein